MICFARCCRRSQSYNECVNGELVEGEKETKEARPKDTITGKTRSLLAALAPSWTNRARFRLHLDVVSFDDGHDQSGKALFDFCTARGVTHLDTDTFTPNQLRFRQAGISTKPSPPGM